MRKSDRVSLAGDQRGAVFADYLTLVAFIGIVVAAAIVLVGLPMLAQYQHMQAVLTSPVV